MYSEWFPFRADAGQLLFPITVRENEDGIPGEELWLLLPVRPVAVPLLMGVCQTAL